MDKRNIMHEFYEICKSMKIQDYHDYLHDDIDMEEKEFFMMINHFFMEKEQNQIINKTGE